MHHAIYRMKGGRVFSTVGTFKGGTAEEAVLNWLYKWDHDGQMLQPEGFEFLVLPVGFYHPEGQLLFRLEEKRERVTYVPVPAK